MSTMLAMWNGWCARCRQILVTGLSCSCRSMTGADQPAGCRSAAVTAGGAAASGAAAAGGHAPVDAEQLDSRDADVDFAAADGALAPSEEYVLGAGAAEAAADHRGDAAVAGMNGGAAPEMQQQLPRRLAMSPAPTRRRPRAAARVPIADRHHRRSSRALPSKMAAQATCRVDTRTCGAAATAHARLAGIVRIS